MHRAFKQFSRLDKINQIYSAITPPSGVKVSTLLCHATQIFEDRNSWAAGEIIQNKEETKDKEEKE